MKRASFHLARRLALVVGSVALAAPWTPAAVAQERIKVGIIAPMSGPFGSYGQKFLNSAKAYQTIHGASVAGRKVELLVRDNSTNTPDMAKRLAQELVSRDKVDFLSGFALTSDALAVAPLAVQTQMPTVLMLAATAGVTQKFPFVTRASYTNRQISMPMGEWAMKNGLKKVYLLASDYAPGAESTEAFEKTFKEKGGEIVGSVKVPFQNLDFSAYVQRIKDAKADAVFTFLPSGEPMGSFMKSFEQRGLAAAGVKVLAATDISPEYLRPMGDAALSLINTGIYYETLDNPESKAYQTAFQALAGQPAGLIALGGFDALGVIYEVTRKLNGDLSDKAKVMASMKGLTIRSPRGAFTIDPQTRGVVQTVYIAKVEKKNGVLVPVVVDRFDNTHD